MIWFVVLTASIGIFPERVHAQLQIEKWGIKSGYNLSFFAEEVNVQPRHRFNIGLSHRTRLLPHFYFVPELIFQARGAKSEEFSNDIFITNNILSLDTPALFRYTFARDHG